MTRMSINRCSTLPEHRGSSSAEKCSTSFSTDIAVLPSLTKRKPARLIRTLDPTCPFHASPLGPASLLRHGQRKSALHMVTAWGCDQRLVLAQIATDAK